MTTDTTELAQREKFEAWAEHACAAPWGYLKKRRTTEGYSEQIYTCMWTAWKAAGAELVEALEKAQRYIEELREWNAGLAQESFERQQRIAEIEPIRAAAEKLVRCKGRYHSEQNYRALAALFGVTTPDLPPLENENVHYADAAEMEITALRQRIAELEEAEQKLCDANVTHDARAELAERRLAEMESRTVTVKQYDEFQICHYGATEDYAKGYIDCQNNFSKWLTAAGIKWEAE